MECPATTTRLSQISVTLVILLLIKPFWSTVPAHPLCRGPSAKYLLPDAVQNGSLDLFQQLGGQQQSPTGFIGELPLPHKHPPARLELVWEADPLNPNSNAAVLSGGRGADSSKLGYPVTAGASWSEQRTLHSGPLVGLQTPVRGMNSKHELSMSGYTDPIGHSRGVRQNDFIGSSVQTEYMKDSERRRERLRARKLRSEPWEQNLLTVLDSQQLSSVKGEDPDLMRMQDSQLINDNSSKSISDRRLPETQRHFTRDATNQQRYITRANTLDIGAALDSGRASGSRISSRSQPVLEQSQPMQSPMHIGVPHLGPLGPNRHNIGTTGWDTRPLGAGILRNIDQDTSAGSGSGETRNKSWLSSQGWQKVSPPVSSKSSVDAPHDLDKGRISHRNGLPPSDGRRVGPLAVAICFTLYGNDCL